MDQRLEQIRTMCQELGKKYPKYFKTEDVPKLMSHLQIPEGETVFLCHDDTLFRSGKDGFVITEKGFYTDLMMEHITYFTPFEKLAGTEQIYETEYVIYADETPLMYSSVGGAEAAEDLIQLARAVKGLYYEGRD
ncbi:MAG: hypothetical protein IJT43_06475 [Stomatobaculum sp.]|nr:hypothetical protein [Stomatobaculum sp.]